MTDYLIEIMKARKEYYRNVIEFNEVLDKWEDEHEDMADFMVGLNWRDKSNQEVRLQFSGEVNQEVIDLLCKEFNLKVQQEYIHKNHLTDNERTEFILRHNEHPYALPEDD